LKKEIRNLAGTTSITALPSETIAHHLCQKEKQKERVVTIQVWGYT
jgi:hypothetical protein